MSDAQAINEERTVWTGSPSQLQNLGAYVVCVLLCWLIVPIFIALWKYLVTRSRQYEVTTQRIFYSSGVFSRQRDQLEIYRVKDMRVVEPFFYRLVGRGNVILDTSDRTTPTFVFESVQEPRALADLLRTHVEARRREKGVRELDME
jgi:uncharacterized membrane protein YdbT with pleckstrin-like domain